MIIELGGRQAIVTGSTSGIGFAIARGLADSGAAVIINGRSQNNVDGATRRLREEVPRAKVEGIAADLASAAGGRARSRSRLYRSSPIRFRFLGGDPR